MSLPQKKIGSSIKARIDLNFFYSEPGGAGLQFDDEIDAAAKNLIHRKGK